MPRGQPVSTAIPCKRYRSAFATSAEESVPGGNQGGTGRGRASGRQGAAMPALSVTAWVQAPWGSLVMTGSEPEDSSTLTVLA